MLCGPGVQDMRRQNTVFIYSSSPVQKKPCVSFRVGDKCLRLGPVARVKLILRLPAETAPAPPGSLKVLLPGHLPAVHRLAAFLPGELGSGRAGRRRTKGIAEWEHVCKLGGKTSIEKNSTGSQKPNWCY